MDWGIAGNEEALSDRITRVVKLHNNSDPFSENLDILVKSVPSGSLNEYLADTIITNVQNAKNFTLLESGTSATLAGNPAYKLVYSDSIEGGPVKAIQVGTIISNKAYYIQYTAESEHYSNNIKIAQDVINSFNVTKS
jgi:hypothetical protein